MSRTHILEPYTRRVNDTRHLVLKILLFAALISFAMVLGFLVALLPMSYIIVPLLPLIGLFGLALWMAPDIDPELDGTVRKLLLLFLLIMMVYPDYVAFTFPGIGWISFGRMAMGLTFILGMYAIATSSRVRGLIAEIITSVKPIYWSFLLLVILQLLLGVVYAKISARLMFAQIFWYYMFIVSCWVFSQDRSARRLFQIMVIGAAVQSVYGLGEWFMQKPIWTDYIPPFMRIDAELLAGITGYTARAGGAYRVASVYLTSLAFAEAVGLTLPFVVHAVFAARSTWFRISAIFLALFLIINGSLTDARSALIGSVIGVLGILGLWSLRRYFTHQKERDIIAPALLWAMPAIGGLMTVAVMFFPRFNSMVFGGVQHVGSTEAREAQWAIAWDRLATNPLGFGPFQAADIIGYRNGEFLTLDSFYINLLMDYGVIGFVLFMLFFLLAAAVAVRTYILADNEEELIAAPLAVAMLSFLVIKSVLSQTENHYLAYAMAGCIVALNWRQQQRLARAAPAPVDDMVPAPVALPAAHGYGLARTR